MKTFEFWVSRTDICMSDYLDSGSGDSVELLYASLGGTVEETAQALLDSANDERWIEDWEGASEEVILTALREGISGLDIRYRNENGDPEDERPENSDREEPNLYVWLRWTVEESR